MTQPLQTIGRERFRRAVAVVQLSNGQHEELSTDWERADRSLWETSTNHLVPSNHGQLNVLNNSLIAPFLKQAKTFNIFPVRIQIYKEHRTEVTYKTTGYERSLDQVKEFGEAT